MHSQQRTFLRCETRERKVVQIDETGKEASRRVNLDGKTALGEVDLYFLRTLLQAPVDFRHVFAQQILDEHLPWVPWNTFFWIHQAQGRRGNDRLFQRHPGVPQSLVEITIGVVTVREGARQQARHPPHVSSSERNAESVGCRVGQSLDAVGPEVMKLPLLTVGDQGRSGCLELLDGLADSRVIKRVQTRVRAVSAGTNGLDQLER